MATKHNVNLSTKKEMQRLDKATTKIVQGINCLLLKSQMRGLTAITTILEQARESIGWWAVHDDYNESHAEKMAHQLALNTGLCAALSFLAKFAMLEDKVIKKELLELIEQFQLKNPLSPEVIALQDNNLKSSMTMSGKND